MERPMEELGKKRAMNWQQFVESGFDGDDYVFPETEGTYIATIACKRWSKKYQLLVYLDLEDGRKIITAIWNYDNFKGVADMPVGTKIEVTFKASKSGYCYLNSAKIIDERTDNNDYED